jgi:hypothetical protein
LIWFYRYVKKWAAEIDWGNTTILFLSQVCLPSWLLEFAYGYYISCFGFCVSTLVFPLRTHGPQFSDFSETEFIYFLSALTLPENIFPKDIFPQNVRNGFEYKYGVCRKITFDSMSSFRTVLCRIWRMICGFWTSLLISAMLFHPVPSWENKALPVRYPLLLWPPERTLLEFFSSVNSSPLKNFLIKASSVSATASLRASLSSRSHYRCAEFGFKIGDQLICINIFFIDLFIREKSWHTQFLA